MLNVQYGRKLTPCPSVRNIFCQQLQSSKRRRSWHMLHPSFFFFAKFETCARSHELLMVHSEFRNRPKTNNLRWSDQHSGEKCQKSMSCYWKSVPLWTVSRQERETCKSVIALDTRQVWLSGGFDLYLPLSRDVCCTCIMSDSTRCRFFSEGTSEAQSRSFCQNRSTPSTLSSSLLILRQDPPWGYFSHLWS